MTTLFLIPLCLLLWATHCLAQPATRTDPTWISLFPQQNELRNTLNLSGMWQFKKDSLAVSETENWQNGLSSARSIAVPGSRNEQFTDSRDYLGPVWYERETYEGGNLP